MVQPATSFGLLLLAFSVIAVAYLVGSFSPAYVVVRRRLGLDIRQLGDGNAGAENVSRIIGVKPAIAVAAIDMGKGLAVVLIARSLAGSVQLYSPVEGSLSGESLRNGLMLAAGASAVIGHSWSVYLRGAGGRGAATAVGALVGLVTVPALLVMLPAFALMYRHRSTTWGLASFFVGVSWHDGPAGLFWFVRPYTALGPLYRRTAGPGGNNSLLEPSSATGQDSIPRGGLRRGLDDGLRFPRQHRGWHIPIQGPISPSHAGSSPID